MYLSARGINGASFCDYFSVFWNWSDSVVIFFYFSNGLGNSSDSVVFSVVFSFLYWIE